jgi:predicted ABC-type ATPase
MNAETPRLRMFAGPNGSGKSTLKSVLRPEFLGPFINPDEIERELRLTGIFDCRSVRVVPSFGKLHEALRNSEFLRSANLESIADHIKLIGTVISIRDATVNSYVASVMADYFRQELLAHSQSFSFETVMSSPDKVAFLSNAQRAGYRTYLYYIATEDPAINVARVRNRVLAGGHPVPEDKIVSRYSRSLDLLADAIRASNRAFLFDNSRTEHVWLAEIIDGSTIDLKVSSVPRWFQHSVLDKL